MDKKTVVSGSGSDEKKQSRTLSFAGKIRSRLFLALMGVFYSAAPLFAGSPKWISPEGECDQPSTWMCFQKTVNLADLPKTVETRIAADSKYWLWINGEPVVTEGGVKRGPNPNDSYFDSVDLAPYLKKGDNLVSALVWYFGKPGFSYNPSGKGALFIDSPSLPGLQTDSTWCGRIHPAYYIPEGKNPNFRLPESNIGFDARKDIPQWESKPTPMAQVVVRGEEGDEPWGKLHSRLIPLWKDYGLKPYENVSVRKGEKSDTIIAKLPYNAQVMPQIVVESPEEGEAISILSDNYMGGGEANVRVEYITSKGVSSYENKGWMNGEHILYIVPSQVDVKSVAYRETGYDTEFAGSFKCSDEFMNRLWGKAARTLYVTMRDTYMDCPDRERAQWWGDAVNESGEAFYALSRSSDRLMEKGMYELIGWQRPDGSIYSPVPSSNWDKELPGQMLASIGYYGFWNYYLNTGDLGPLRDLYPGVKRYMGLWKKLPDGTIADRDGGWHWGDWGDNIDKVALYNALYYLAQRGQRQIALALGLENEADSIASEMESLKEGFNSVFWNGKAYRHPLYDGLTDDRVQAVAVVAGLVDPDKYPLVFETLKESEHASPYMEKYVTEALFKMGEGSYGLERMKRRFTPMVNNKDYSTLFEGWGIGKEGFGGGTTNHAWSGGGLTILSQYVCGVSPLAPGYSLFRVAPDLCGLSFAETVVPSVKGDIRFAAKQNDGVLSFSFNTPEGSEALVELPNLPEEISVNGSPVWKDGLFLDSPLGFKPETPSKGSFRLAAGSEWKIEAKLKR